VAVAFACAVVACSSSSTTPGWTTDGGNSEGGPAGEGGTGDGGAEATVDAGPLNDCTEFLDRSAPNASRTVTWGFALAQSPERCLQIKAGQTVTYGNGAGGPGDFAMFKLQPAGGDSPNPFADLDTQTGQVVFANAGSFGYGSSDLPVLRGAVKVVP